MLLLTVHQWQPASACVASQRSPSRSERPSEQQPLYFSYSWILLCCQQQCVTSTPAHAAKMTEISSMQHFLLISQLNCSGATGLCQQAATMMQPYVCIASQADAAQLQNVCWRGTQRGIVLCCQRVHGSRIRTQPERSTNKQPIVKFSILTLGLGNNSVNVAYHKCLCF